MIPTTYLSLHDVRALRASVHRTVDTPLVLNIDSPHGSMQISMYLRDVSPARVQAAADALNAVLSQPEPPQAACPIEKAAYAAEHAAYHWNYWEGLKRDLDRHPIDKPDEETCR